MSYQYEHPETGRLCNLTLKKAAPEWLNFDCPTIYKDGWTVLRSEMGGVYYNEHLADPAEELEEFKALYKFIIASDKAFEKKYPQCANGLGLVQNFIRANTSMMARVGAEAIQ